MSIKASEAFEALNDAQSDLESMLSVLGETSSDLHRDVESIMKHVRKAKSDINSPNAKCLEDILGGIAHMVEEVLNKNLFGGQNLHYLRAARNSLRSPPYHGSASMDVIEVDPKYLSPPTYRADFFDHPLGTESSAGRFDYDELFLEHFDDNPEEY
ncbi:hypothetical protein COV82_04315 [Candidatus Peregrinibacteria bacterium CG11_big_fil_rev_8_21_14_0_20_46_8]|nr:MAG: hypothetical protein COV82_04315 [Candidatus Peregrinibacteria bacterium CG11_big_fil_rev_8_21_14_0_20_46_8]